MEDRSGKGEVSISVDHPDKILELGDSIDIGKCKEQKKDGSGCTNLVSGTGLRLVNDTKAAARHVAGERGHVRLLLVSREAGVQVDELEAVGHPVVLLRQRGHPI